MVFPNRRECLQRFDGEGWGLGDAGALDAGLDRLEGSVAVLGGQVLAGETLGRGGLVHAVAQRREVHAVALDVA